MSLHSRLEELARLGAGSNGIDRALFTPPEYAARARIAAWGRAAGFAISQDRAGNLFVRFGDQTHPAVQCGSHLDTVKGGGPYDGAYGVVGGLEALLAIARAHPRPERPFELVAWAGEEGSRFPLGTLGSSAYAGITPPDELDALVADDGETFAHALDGPTGLLEGVPVRDGFPPPAAYVELHIEQGPVMERAGARLGVVSAIAGQRRMEIVIDGVAGHAGTMPMAGRADALCAASDVILAVEAAANAIGEAVATVGWIAVAPNQTNVVPGRVSLRVDIRSVEDGRIAAIESRIRVATHDIAQARKVAIAVAVIETRAATPMDARLRNVIRDVCSRLDGGTIDIASGAGHDAMCVARVAPAAMIFVPSIGGRSHVGDERTAPADLDLGVEALARSLLGIAAAG
jgi:hydantoinase/carbamoylase family amidase